MNPAYAGSTSSPRSTLIANAALSAGCWDHVVESGPPGRTGHYSINGDSPGTRFNKYGSSSSWGENLAYADYSAMDLETAYDVVQQLVIDDGVSGNGHRDNIYKASWTHHGAACGCHKTYGAMCCIMYGIGAANKTSFSTAKARVAYVSKSNCPTGGVGGGTSSGGGGSTAPTCSNVGPDTSVMSSNDA